MKKVKQNILLYISKKLNIKDKMLLMIFKKYTIFIYKMGFDDGYNFEKFKGCNKAENVKSDKKKDKM